jgi:hypothetical protein
MENNQIDITKYNKMIEQIAKNRIAAKRWRGEHDDEMKNYNKNYYETKRKGDLSEEQKIKIKLQNKASCKRYYEKKKAEKLAANNTNNTEQ